MNRQGLHPFFLIMALLGIGSGLYTLHQRNPSITALILALSLFGLAWRWWSLSESGSDKPVLDFERLRTVDIVRYGPWIKQNVRGHDAVIDDILSEIQQGLSLAGANRTLGAFLLAGPTGTGKTFLAELVAQALYPKSEPLILRMNQYKHSDDVFTLIGPPPGAPGYEVGGTLTSAVLENPYRVVILDEVDKAHIDVQHCLYNVLDTAHCREKSTGKNVHFNGCVFFATCNAGVESLRKANAEKGAVKVGRMRDAMARDGGFEKAFLARFEGIYLLDELSDLHVAEVACLQFKQHWKQYGIDVEYASPEVLLDAMRQNVEFKEYGVRQLSRLIQDQTDSSIQEARRAGFVRVRLDIDGAGRLKAVPSA